MIHSSGNQSVEQLIDKINRASQLEEVLNTKNLKQAYRRAIRLLHPDLCDVTEAIAALIKLNRLKEAYDKRNIQEDDAGTFRVTKQAIFFHGKQDLLQISYDNYCLLKNFRDAASVHFHRYLPESMGISTELKVSLRHKAVPIRGLTLPQKHVNWILSRMLEVCAWLAQVGYVHAGISPESVFIVPERHGILLTSFYHLTKNEHRLTTISAKYKHWYPDEIFKHKRAKSLIDLELSKRTAAYLLGDKSGMGINLRKTHHKPFIDFLLDRHTDAYDCFTAYRKLLKNNFKMKYHPLLIEH